MKRLLFFGVLAASLFAIVACAGRYKPQKPVSDTYCQLAMLIDPEPEVLDALENELNAGRLKPEILDRFLTRVLESDDRYMKRCGQ